MSAATSNPSDTGGMSVTLKETGKKDGKWFVFHGSVERCFSEMAEAFGFEDSEIFEWNLHQLAIAAEHSLNGAGNAARGLGAHPIPKSEAEAPSGSAGGSGDVWDQVAQEKGSSAPAEPEVTLLDTISAINSVADLKTLWAENRAAFDADPEALTAWKARGKELKALTEAAA